MFYTPDETPRVLGGFFCKRDDPQREDEASGGISCKWGGSGVESVFFSSWAPFRHAG